MFYRMFFKVCRMILCRKQKITKKWVGFHRLGHICVHRFYSVRSLGSVPNTQQYAGFLCSCFFFLNSPEGSIHFDSSTPPHSLVCHRIVLYLFPAPPFVCSVLVYVQFTSMDLCTTARLNTNSKCTLTFLGSSS